MPDPSNCVNLLYTVACACVSSLGGDKRQPEMRLAFAGYYSPLLEVKKCRKVISFYSFQTTPGSEIPWGSKDSQSFDVEFTQVDSLNVLHALTSFTKILHATRGSTLSAGELEIRSLWWSNCLTPHFFLAKRIVFSCACS